MFISFVSPFFNQTRNTLMSSSSISEKISEFVVSYLDFQIARLLFYEDITSETVIIQEYLSYFPECIVRESYNRVVLSSLEEDMMNKYHQRLSMALARLE